MARACRYCKEPKKWHGPECMREWIQWAKGQVPPHANQHTCTALVGPPGAGKSGGGLCIFIDVQEQPFVVRDQVHFRTSDRIHVARRLGKGLVVYGDESSGKGGNKRRAMSAENVDNMVDLDTMRQRNQHTVFTSPEFGHLDPAIQEACQWVHEFHKDRHVVSYEVQHRGKPDNRYHFLKERFQTEAFPHAELVHPELWAELRACKDEYLAGADDKSAHAARQFEDRARLSFGALLGGLKAPKGRKVA